MKTTELETRYLPDDFPRGINGEVACIAACLRRGGVPCTFAEAMGVTGTAFRAHFFSPLDNPGLPTEPDPDRPDARWAPRYDWASHLFNNYGHLESAAYYYGGELRRAEGLERSDFWKVVEFELEAGRPLIACGVTGRLRADLVTGATLEKDPLRLMMRLRGEGREVDVEIGDETEGWELLLVRPGPRESYRSSDHERRMDALRWAVSHAENRVELIHEARRFYATGLRAMERFGEFLLEGISEELAEPMVCPEEEAPLEIASFCTVTIEEWTRARRAAAAFFEQWALEVETYGKETPGLIGGAGALRELGCAYAAVAGELSSMTELLPPPGEDEAQARLGIIDIQRRKCAEEILASARRREQKAVQSLKDMLAT